jgi:cytochrome c-type biogenesis protein
MDASLTLTVAFTAGVLSFLSPCVLPLIPSYATFVTGMSLDELTGRPGRSGRPRRVGGSGVLGAGGGELALATEGRAGVRRAVLVHGGLFVLGFSLVFMMLGASATVLGSLLRIYGDWVGRVGGVILVFFGLYLLGVFRIGTFAREARVHLAEKPVGYAGSLLVGVAFGAGWTPCIGPVLGGILTLAATQGSMAQGVGLLAAYSAGLAVPFLLATLLLDRFIGWFAGMRRLIPWVNRASGAILVLLGLLLISGSFTWLSGMMARWTPAFLMNRL